ncbi:phosphonate ABC transporter, permease protein PhnE [Roseitranquillus sediminis]|uniref:phosphonate ABC transporter, permease protein PhnE n=1 Tax=Roseitranquillus sediminis TaxID=2809051 RepID=UPI001D0BF97B|nr:phosphonate ABC transporter, permease protein PhnE [Roseitranquillus sediminis]
MITAADRPTTHAAWPAMLPSLVVAAVVIWAAATTETDWNRLGEAGPRILEFLGRMLPPDLSVMPEVARGLAETLRIAVLGTLGCVLASLVLGPLAAARLAPAWVHRPVRSLLALIRAIPLLLVAMLMVGAVGLGPLPGILAVAVHATGMLAKFYAEALDDVDVAPVAALESAGATLLQRLRFAYWPQIAPVVLRDTIFRFELNLRESLILGIVGAGGIGFYIQTYVRSFQYEKAATVTLAIAIVILLIEGANGALRRWVS